MEPGMKFKMLLILGAVISLLSGCVSKQLVPMPDQTKAIEDSSKARIYVVRPTSIGGAVPFTVWDGDKKVGSTRPNGYICWERPPGDTVIRSEAENTATLQLKCESGKVYYIGQHVTIGWLYSRNQLRLMADDEGKKKVAACSPSRVQ
jgi:hypothetical protein